MIYVYCNSSQNSLDWESLCNVYLPCDCSHRSEQKYLLNSIKVESKCSSDVQLILHFRLTVLDNRASSRNQRDSTMVALLFSIVLLFICCHFCKLILNLYEASQMIWFGTIEQWPKWADNLAQWNHLLLVVNSSGNILIYIVKVRIINQCCQTQPSKLIGLIQLTNFMDVTD